MDVKIWIYREHERLSNDLHLDTKEQRFYCCSIFYCHSKVFSNGHNSYTFMSVK